MIHGILLITFLCLFVSYRFEQFRLCFAMSGRHGHRHGQRHVVVLLLAGLGLRQLSALQAFSFTAEPRSEIPRRAVTTLQPEITKLRPLPSDGLPGSNVVAITKPQEPWARSGFGVAWIVTHARYRLMIASHSSLQYGMVQKTVR